jgi:uncharacterized protein YkwD
MKKRNFRVLLSLLLFMTIISCEKADKAADGPALALNGRAGLTPPTPQAANRINAGTLTYVTEYNYSTEEKDFLTALNNYRVGLGKNALIFSNHISYVSKDHSNDMAATFPDPDGGYFSLHGHDYFTERSTNLANIFNSAGVGECAGYNYQTGASYFNGLLGSPPHKAIVEGDYTHVGVGVTANAGGKKYYTTLFMKKTN